MRCGRVWCRYRDWNLLDIPVHGTHLAHFVAIAAFRWNIFALDLPRKQPSSERIVDHDIDTVPVTCRDDLVLERAQDGVVHPLIDCRLDPPPLVAHGPDLRDLERGEVAQPQLHELALLVQLVQRLQRLRERDRPVRRVQVEDVHAVRPQLVERLGEHLAEHLRLVEAGLGGVPFRREGEAAVLPLRLRREGLLLAADVAPRRVDLVVALLLEVVEAGVVVV